MASYTNLPTFTSGQVLRANGDGSTYAGMNDLKNNLDLVNAQSVYPYRNLLYNGQMAVSQRSTSRSSITGSGYWTTDRWATYDLTLGTWTQSVENDGPAGTGIAKSLKMLCTTADASPASGDVLRFEQPLEGQDLQRIMKGSESAIQITMSFWVKSNVTGTYIVWLYDNDNNRHVSASYTVSASGSWEYKTITFPADTTGAFDNDNAASLYVSFILAAGSDRTSGTLATSWQTYSAANVSPGQTNLAAATSNYWQITGVQLEVGSVATPFEFLPYGDELRRCQRYYYRITASAGAPYTRWASGYCTSTTAAECLMIFPVTMRAIPTSLETTGTASQYCVVNSSGGAVALSAVPSLNSASPAGMQIACPVSAGLTGGNATSILSNNTAAAYLGFSAEL